jgi:hypothetical protein
MGDLDKVRFGGKIVDRRTSEMLAEAERLAQAEDPSIDDFHLTQGCFHTGVAASAGTHSGPGAFDMYSAGYTSEQKEIIGMALRKVGFASWRRRESQGPWKEHWHGIAMDTEGLPPIAARQVNSYLNGRDGLRGNGEDPDPRPKDINTWEEYQQERGADQPEPVAVGAGAAGGTAPGPPPDPYGMDPGNNLDSDADGLTDAFERLAGTSLLSADTDADGMSDAYEAAQSHTDPLSGDTDRDGVGDAAELAAGSDAGRLPGMAGVVGTGVFAENVRDGVKDADADGLSDHAEKLVGLRTTDSDSDDDGLSDGAEASLGTDPLLADSDHDGLTDDLEIEHGSDPLGSFVDSTGRTIRTAPWTLEAAYARHVAAQQEEAQSDAGKAGAGAATGTQDPFAIDPGEPPDVDTDDDGLTDAFEKLAGTSLTSADTDADGLSDGFEALKSKTDPLAPDTDADQVDDAQEVSIGSDAGSLPGVAGVVGTGALAENVRDGVADSDQDGLSDHAEKVLKTDANNIDSDADKLSDAMEISLGTNPLLADTDSDGIYDAVEAQYGLDPLVPGSSLGVGGPGAGVGGHDGDDPYLDPQPTDAGSGLDAP